MKRRLILCLFGWLGLQQLHAQTVSTARPDTVNRGRMWTAVSGNAALYGGSLALLDQYWYKSYPRSSFHFFNDSREWNQMDKAGHLFTTYCLGRYSMEVWRWTGMSYNRSVWLGGLSGILYQTIIETLDGFSSNWGFSGSDMLANTAGAALLIGQEVAWHEQRIQVKFSAHINHYTADPVVGNRTRDLFGDAFLERILKDYNAQTCWLSINIHAFRPQSALPGWLNIAVGYGAEQMYAGRENRWISPNGFSYDYTSVPRIRQFYLSPDIDLTRIHTRKKGIRVLLQVLNMIKIPAPALEVNSRGKVKLHALYF